MCEGLEQCEIEPYQACYSSDYAKGAKALALDTTPAQSGMSCNSHLFRSKGRCSTTSNIDICSSEIANTHVDAAISAL